jgi:hypothetical protein
MKMGTYMRLLQSRGFLLELRFRASQEAWVASPWRYDAAARRGAPIA